MSTAVRLGPWRDGDLGLVQELFGDPRMMEHLGGPQSPEQNRHRLDRWKANPGTFKVVELASGRSVGFVGFWPLTWRGGQVLETGWSVIPAFQRRGIAAAAAALVIELARAADRPDDVRTLHAFPAVENTASNAVCRRLGFTLLGATVFEAPPRPRLHCHNWYVELNAARHSPRSERGSPSSGSR